MVECKKVQSVTNIYHDIRRIRICSAKAVHYCITSIVIYCTYEARM